MMYTLNLLLVALFAVTTASATTSGYLQGCDDCFSPAISLEKCPIQFNGIEYGAYAVS